MKSMNPIVVYDRDALPSVDSVTVNGLPLTDAANPVNDVFNSTYWRFGVSASSGGDLPQLTGLSRSMSGIDLDTFDVTAMLGNSLALNTVYTANEVLFSGVLATALPVEGVPEPATFALMAVSALVGSVCGDSDNRPPLVRQIATDP